MRDNIHVPGPDYGVIQTDVQWDDHWTEKWAEGISEGMGFGLGDLRDNTPVEETILDQEHDYSTWFKSTITSDLRFGQMSPVPWPKSIDGDEFGPFIEELCGETSELNSYEPEIAVSRIRSPSSKTERMASR
ncbi:Mss4-like protein [Apiospora arundinis]